MIIALVASGVLRRSPTATSGIPSSPSGIRRRMQEDQRTRLWSHRRQPGGPICRPLLLLVLELRHRPYPGAPLKRGQSRRPGCSISVVAGPCNHRDRSLVREVAEGRSGPAADLWFTASRVRPTRDIEPHVSPPVSNGFRDNNHGGPASAGGASVAAEARASSGESARPSSVHLRSKISPRAERARRNRSTLSVASSMRSKGSTD